MIKIPQEKSTDYKSLEKLIQNMETSRDLADYFHGFIANYKKLDDKFSFGESFDEGFIFEQLNEKLAIRDRPLFGIPFGVKDVFNTKTLPTTMGSEVWQGFMAGNNARVVDEIADRGGLVFSKTTTAEFAVHYIQAGGTLNPHNTSHITGTSSAGSAVAVACGALPICLGTQTAGSIVRPASFCGAYGFKPSFGAIDRTGVLKTADTLDTIGLLGSDIYGLRKVFYEIFQKDRNYPNAKKYFDHYSCFKEKSKLKIGIVTNQFRLFVNYKSYVKDTFDQFINELKAPELVFEEVPEIEFINEIHSLHDTIYCRSLSYYFEEEHARGSGVSDLMTQMISKGEGISKGAFIDALARQPDYRLRFDTIFKNYDFILTPSTASAAPALGETELDDTNLIWTFMGYPVISLPVFWSDELGLPYGLQIVAPKFDDFSLLDFSQSVLDKLADRIESD
jgi:Asp-tRNA(Asn)/Glu-tRNA(Gln) amidotransferase A subunit family amidase